jgi:hypothetical protein
MTASASVGVVPAVALAWTAEAAVSTAGVPHRRAGTRNSHIDIQQFSSYS